MLLCHAFRQMRQIPYSAFDLALCGFELARAHQRRRTLQTPAGAVRDSDNHRQIPQQLLGWG